MIIDSLITPVLFIIGGYILGNFPANIHKFYLLVILNFVWIWLNFGESECCFLSETFFQLVLMHWLLIDISLMDLGVLIEFSSSNLTELARLSWELNNLARNSIVFN